MIKPIVYIFLLFVWVLWPDVVLSQQVSQKLAAAYNNFKNDPQLRYGITSLYVVDAKTGKVVFEHNGRTGLVPASTQKVITSISAYELLGKGFRFETKFAWQKEGERATLLIIPGGDPTLGSLRWAATQEEAILKGVAQAIGSLPTKSINKVLVQNGGWNTGNIPDGWLWQDIGNYYGAGAAGFNWLENQYDVFLRSGKGIGDPVTIVRTAPKLVGHKLRSEVTSAAAGSGDSAYIYFPLYGTEGIIRGTIPVNKNAFKISGALPDPLAHFAAALQQTIAGTNIKITGKAMVTATAKFNVADYTIFHTVSSPAFDSMMYWFNRKSVNLYGEALVKAIAIKYKGAGATDKGTAMIRSFWKQKGIPEGELSMVDGSGLSPLNRVTTHALAGTLLHAQKQPWFNGFHHSLPVYNGMKMKSGTMQGVKGFCGYYQSKDGNEYIFAFLVNNYSGTSGAITQKMYRVLDALK